MKILALSDQVAPLVYSPALRDHFADVDLIVGCGDLPAYYLEYVVTLLNVPLLYVHGNHDPDTYRVPGGINVDGSVVKVKGLTIAGFGGSRRYKSRGKHQYTESQMRCRMILRSPQLLIRRILFGHGVDLLITHAPPLGIHDQPDLPHMGFDSFLKFMRIFRPKAMVHGHIHVHPNIHITQSRYAHTWIFNVCPYREVNL